MNTQKKNSAVLKRGTVLKDHARRKIAGVAALAAVEPQLMNLQL